MAPPPARKYEFGDKGSSWRMIKLKRVFELAERESLAVEEVALERYGSLEEFEDALAERDYLSGKSSNNKTVNRKRSIKFMDPRSSSMSSVQKETTRQTTIPVAVTSNHDIADNEDIMSVDQLNKLYSKLLKARMMGSSNVEDLEKRYEIEKQRSENSRQTVVVLPNIDSRGNLKASGNRDTMAPGSEEVSVSDMVMHEKMGANDGYDSVVARRIMTDGGFKADLDYMDDRAEQLAQKKHKTIPERGRKIAINGKPVDIYHDRFSALTGG
jgi:hypothetical protein